MSRNADRIRKALETKGYTIRTLLWEPIRAGAEMQGAEGGWFVEFDPGAALYGWHEIGGTNITAVLEEIGWLRPAEPEQEG